MSRRMGEFTKDTEPPKTTTGFEGSGGGGWAGVWGAKTGRGDKKDRGLGESNAWRK
jgi:hypothetical protein